MKEPVMTIRSQKNILFTKRNTNLTLEGRKNNVLWRRAPGYWKEPLNLEIELRQFWASLGITIQNSEPPSIPNEALLNHFNRHDLRYGIYAQGGREIVSQALNGARIMPGKWNEAVEKSPELKQLLLQNHNGLSSEIPPMPFQVRKRIETSTIDLNDSTNSDSFDPIKLYYKNRWKHRNGRRSKNHWSKELVLSELYQYLESCKQQDERPAAWMPRLSELSSNGHDDLRQAIHRLIGNQEEITKTACLIPYREWKFFEDQYLLLVELQTYIDLYQMDNNNQKDDTNINYNDSERVFPRLADLKKNGAITLYDLVQQFGGRKMVANRLSMRLAPKHKKTTIVQDLQWGSFDLSFAVDLMGYIRENQMKLTPPLDISYIKMPNKDQLINDGEFGKKLDSQIMLFGGYENVARRLGLAYFDER